MEIIKPVVFAVQLESSGIWSQPIAFSMKTFYRRFALCSEVIFGLIKTEFCCETRTETIELFKTRMF